MFSKAYRFYRRIWLNMRVKHTGTAHARSVYKSIMKYAGSLHVDIFKGLTYTYPRLSARKSAMNMCLYASGFFSTRLMSDDSKS